MTMKDIVLAAHALKKKYRDGVTEQRKNNSLV
jgi:gluconate kinase